jgi:2-dehydropantoate 2-reductase
MKIGVIGPGAIGLLFAYYLQKESRSVTVYTRTREQALYLNRHGIMLKKGNETDVVFPKVQALGESVLEDNYLFIAVKQYQLESLLPYLRKSTSKNIVFLQNGMSHLSLIQNMQEKHIAVGIVEHGAKKEGAGIVHHTGIGSTKLGVVRGTMQDFEPIFTLFSNEFSLFAENDWKSILIKKIIINACINPLTALYRVKNGELLENPYFQGAMKQVLLEALEALGETDEDGHWERVCAVCRNTALNQSSMLTDILHKRPTEADAILGFILQEGQRRDIQTPTISFLYQSVKGLEG